MAKSIKPKPTPKVHYRLFHLIGTDEKNVRQVFYDVVAETDKVAREAAEEMARDGKHKVAYWEIEIISKHVDRVVLD